MSDDHAPFEKHPTAEFAPKSFSSPLQERHCKRQFSLLNRHFRRIIAKFMTLRSFEHSVVMICASHMTGENEAVSCSKVAMFAGKRHFFAGHSRREFVKGFVLGLFDYSVIMISLFDVMGEDETV